MGNCSVLTALYCRMDPFEETLRRLKESFNTGKTKPAKFRAEQLQSLGRFLQDNNKQLHDALAGDLGKVLWTVGRGASMHPWRHRGAVCPSQASYILSEVLCF